MLAFLVAIPLIAHGMAHLSGVLAPWTQLMQGYSNASWLFSRRAPLASAIGRLYGLVWLIAGLSLMFSGAMLIAGLAGWIAAALFGCILSLASILIWWSAVPLGAKGGALFDLVILILLLSPLRYHILAYVN